MSDSLLHRFEIKDTDIPIGYEFRNGFLRPVRTQTEGGDVIIPYIISTEINSETVTEVAKLVFEAIRSKSKGIKIALFTYGGDANAEFGVYDALKYASDQGIFVTVTGLGTVQSAGVVILQAASRRILSPNCQLYLHPTQSICTNALQLNRELLSLKQGEFLSSRYATIIAERSMNSIEQVQEWRQSNGGNGSYMTALEAIENNLADELLKEKVLI